MSIDAASSAGQLSVRMRTGLPTPLAIALEQAHSRHGSDADRLNRRLGFLDGLLRFLVAVQDVERATIGLPRPADAANLINRLSKPTLGLWANAARALARTLEPATTRPLAPTGAHLLSESHPFTAACNGLMAIRNQHAHGNELLNLTEAKAAQMLAHSDPLWRDLVRGLDPLCSLTLVQKENSRQLPNDRFKIQLSVLRGTEPSVQEFQLDDDPLPVGCPALLTAEGTLLRTLPWMALAPPLVTREVLLLHSWENKGPVWTTVLGQRTTPTVAGDLAGADDPSAWIEANTSTRRRSLSTATARGLLKEPEADRPPQVRALQPIRRLGRGGTGEVWLVADGDRDGALMALKILHPMLAAQREQKERLRREYEALRTLQIRGVVQVVDFFEDDERGACLQMEYVEGESLQSRLLGGPLKKDEALTCVRALLDTLHIVHERGIVHRDLKPSNILLEDGRPRLIDFGVARLHGAAALTATADMVGTVRYAAPEQFMRSDVGPQADLYSLGVVLREMLLGVDAEPERLSDLSPGLQRVIAKATRREPAQRFESAREMAITLAQAEYGAFDGAALMAGDQLPGGLTVLGQLCEPAPGLYLLSARTRDGKPVAVLTGGPARQDRLAFRDRIDAMPSEIRREHGCSRIIETEQLVPYIELIAEGAESRAIQLLHPGTATPPPEPAQRPSPPEEVPPPKTPNNDDSGAVLLALGAMAAGAVAAHAIGNSTRKSPPSAAQPPRTPTANRGSALGALLTALVKHEADQTHRVLPASTDLAEGCHHLGMLLLGLEVEFNGLALTDQHWRSAWGTRYGGLSMLLTLCDRGCGPISKVMLARPERAALLKLIPELSRSKGSPTPSNRDRLLSVRQVMVEVLAQAARAPDAQKPLRSVLVCIKDGQFQVRRAKATDGWWAINLGS